MGVWGRFVAAGGQRRVTCEQVWYGVWYRYGMQVQAGQAVSEQAGKQYLYSR